MRVVVRGVVLAVLLAGCQVGSSNSAQPVVFQAPQDDTFDVAPANSPGSFFHQFVGMVNKARKGEYETTQEHELRIRNPGGMKPFSSKAEYAFALPGEFLQYDADSAVYRLTNYRCYDLGELIDAPRRLGCYLGVHAIETASDLPGPGTQYPRLNQYLLSVDEDLGKHMGMREMMPDFYSVPFTCPVPVERARKHKDDLVRMAVVGLIEQRYYGYGSAVPMFPFVSTSAESRLITETYTLPFVPTKVVCYVETTGEILSSQTLPLIDHPRFKPGAADA